MINYEPVHGIGFCSISMTEEVVGLRFVLQTIGFNAAETGSIKEARLSEFEDFC